MESLIVDLVWFQFRKKRNGTLVLVCVFNGCSLVILERKVLSKKNSEKVKRERNHFLEVTKA